jgi:DNA primase
MIASLKKQLVLAETKIKASSMDFHNPEVAAKLIQENLEYDEAGNPTNLEQVLKDLAKQNPFLVKPKQEQAQEQTTPAQTASQQRAPMIPVNNPGRSVISPPGQLPPNRPVRLSEVYGNR